MNEWPTEIRYILDELYVTMRRSGDIKPNEGYCINRMSPNLTVRYLTNRPSARCCLRLVYNRCCYHCIRSSAKTKSSDIYKMRGGGRYRKKYIEK